MAVASSSNFLEIRGLTRRFGERVAVSDLSFSVGRGEIFGLLGPNGAGKSTTFHLLTGLLPADAGEVFLDGQAASPTDPATRERIGVVFQHPSLDGKLTGLENLKLGAALHGLTGATARREIDRMLALMDLRDRAGEPVERFSGGMRRRLELARVLLHDPELLIMDEPGAGIDQASLRTFWRLVLDLRRERRTTILVTTHQPEEAEHCDRLAILDQGRLIACDTPEGLRGRVGGDVVVLEGDRPEELRELAATILLESNDLAGSPRGEDAGPGEARVLDGKVLIERRNGHTLIPRLVEKLPAGRLRSVSLRRPTLADVFVKLTGRGLATDNDSDGAAPGEGASRKAGRKDRVAHH